jgi:endo-1,4-beta-mannosidase
VSFMDPDQREQLVRQATLTNAQSPMSRLDILVDEARRHHLQLVTATWDGERWHATFSRSGA